MENTTPTLAGKALGVQSIAYLDSALTRGTAELLHETPPSASNKHAKGQIPGERNPSLRSEMGPAERLFRAGFVEVIGVIPPAAPLSPSSKLRPESVGKIPGLKTPEGWIGHRAWPAHITSLADAMQWDSDGASVGVRTGRICAVDIDVTDEGLAAELRALALAHLGNTGTRVGNAPKVLLPYISHEGAARSRQLAFVNGMVEILGRGRHFVAHGTHPKTGKSYTWDRDLVEIGLGHLPTVTEAQIESFLNAAEQILVARGLAVTSHSKGRERAVVCQESLLAPSFEALKEAVANIPNRLETTRQEWLCTGIAIKAAAGAEYEDEAFEVFSEWSERWPGCNAPEYVGDTWDSLQPPFALGWDYLVSRTTGFNAAQYDFEVLDEPGPVIEPLPSEGERIAALTGDAEAVFLQEAMQYNGDLSVRWDRLQAATSAVDPLSRLFRSVVFPAALHAPVDRRDVAFQLAARAKLENNFQWSNLSAVEQTLLLKAAQLVLQKDGSLERRYPTPVLELPGREYLIDQLVPKRALVALVGAPGQGKSWCGLEMAALIGRTPDKNVATFAGGLAVRHHGSVWYFASEDEIGFHERRQAWEQVHGRSEHLHLFASVPLLSGPLSDSILFLREAAKQSQSPPALIVIDVFTDTVVGDENAVSTMGPALYRAKVLGRIFGASVLLIHHASKARPEDARGSSAFAAAVDVMMSVVSDDRGIRLKVVKHRSAPAGDEYRFHISQGVLRNGPAAVVQADGAYSIETAAELVGRLVNEIADNDTPVSQTRLIDQLKATRADLFQGESRPEQQKMWSRAKRAITRAKERGYVAGSRRGFVPGPITPPSELSEALP